LNTTVRLGPTVKEYANPENPLVISMGIPPLEKKIIVFYFIQFILNLQFIFLYLQNLINHIDEAIRICSMSSKQERHKQALTKQKRRQYKSKSIVLVKFLIE